MMVDTGAVYTCVNSNYISHLPLSGKCAKTIRFSGQMQLIPTTAPVCLQKKKNYITMPILESNQTPVNLLGRDALFKLGLDIWCSPEGVGRQGQKGRQQMVRVERTVQVTNREIHLG